MITFSHKGNLTKTMNFLRRNRKLNYDMLNEFGRQGVEALRSATPVDTGLTADSWSYRIVQDSTHVSIEWLNSNVSEGWANVAVLLQYGHATGTGGWVEGIDYINPAIQPIFDKIAKNVWKAVTQ